MCCCFCFVLFVGEECVVLCWVVLCVCLYWLGDCCVGVCGGYFFCV